ncbi:CYFA0S32e00738g1_1 [Cyberlindnera fabianii]|uniref:CYFA0S32e00738g1_1 n=1 Tax=Cyberlindnera fabianii TaxID=36022 RepID=A0A061BC06_CYBFA|nr:CYFA0S32e00738g1_1 [Cyberlindnera fabianii]
MSTKQYLKAAKQALQDGNAEYCVSLAEDALEIDPKSYFAYVFIGKASHLLGKIKEACDAYKKAIAIEPDNLMAWKGLVLVVKNTDDYKSFFETMADYIQVATAQGHAIADLLNDIDSYRKKYSSEEVKEEYLRQLLPDGKLQQATHGLLMKPVSAITNYLDILLKREKKEMFQVVVREKMKKKNNTDKADAAAWQFYQVSQIPHLYEELINIQDDDEKRRDTEEQLLKYRHSMLKAAPLDAKQKIFAELKEMVEGMVLVKHTSFYAWSLYFDWIDVDTLSDFDPQVLKNFIVLFKDHPLGQIVHSFLMSDMSTYNIELKDDKETKENIEATSSEEQALQELTVAEDDLSLTQDELISVMTQALQSCKTSLFAHRIVLAYHIHSKKYPEAYHICQSAIQLLASTTRSVGYHFPKTKKDYLINFGLVLTYYEAPKNYKRALEIFDKVLAESPDNVKARVGKGLILADRGELENSRDLLSRICSEFPDNEEALMELSWVQIRLDEHEVGRDGLLSVLKNLKGNSLYMLELKARVNWRIAESYSTEKNYSKAYEHLVDSLRSFPNYASSYTSLGYIYLNAYNDHKRAKKCFVKAFELDTSEVKAAYQLVSEATEQTEWSAAQVICTKVLESENAKRNLGQDSWPYRILGCTALEQQDAAKAVEWFQNAIRLNKEDTESWVGLGEAYAGCGRLEAAAKVFRRALELVPDHWVAKYLLGSMQFQIGEFEDALEIFEDVLKVKPNEECVVAGMYETLYSYASDCVLTGFFGKAIGLALRAFEYLEQGNVESYNFWKTLSDLTQLFLQVQSKIDLFPHEKLLAILKKSNLEINESLIQEYVGNQKPVELVSLFLVYINKAALALEPRSRPLHSSVLYNLGLSQLIAFLNTKNTEYRDEAIEVLKRSIKMQNNYQEPWIALGIASISVNPRVAQHCFIKASSIDQRNVSIWSNLALLYLRYGDNNLATEAYMRGQSLAPTEPISWLGHALAADAQGDRATSSNMYTHAFVLSNGKNPGAQLAYGVDVCLKRIGQGGDFKDIEAVQELSTASYGMVQYLKHYPLDRFGLEVCCLILERLNDYKLGLEISGQLLGLLESAYEETEDENVLNGFARIKAQTARFELGCKEYETAIESCLECLELSEDEKTVISCRTVLGLAYFFTDNFDGALDEFKQVLTLSNDAKRLIVLISQVLYIYDTEETRQAALDQLFHSIENQGSSLVVALVIGAISVIENLEDYMESIKSELESLSLEELIADRNKNVPYLISKINERLGQNSQSVWQKSAFLFPGDLEVWRQIDKNVALKIAKSGKVTAEELSDRYTATGQLKDTQRSLFLAPWNNTAAQTLRGCF